jgi:regulator of replication initiation timing
MTNECIERIKAAIVNIESKVEEIMSKNQALQSQNDTLVQENHNIRVNTQIVASQVEEHVIELEKIKNKYDNSNNNN